MYDYLIVGAGLYGAVFARQAKERGKSEKEVQHLFHISAISCARFPKDFC